jgi:hypothetical protein
MRLLALLLLAAPAGASDLSALTARIDATGSAGLAAAYAACLQGQGDVDRTAAFFTARGWERIDDDEIGQVELHAAAAPYIVTLWVDAARCEVASASLGTDAAQAALAAAALAAGLVPQAETEAADCPRHRLGDARIEITATALNRRCTAAATSAARFLFGNRP